MYPNKPDTYLTVDGVDLFDMFGMVLVDGYSMPPPKPKTYTVDIPGGNGSLDLSEALFGDVAYSKRQQAFEFYIFNVSDPDGIMRDITNFIHGKRHKYVFSLDQAYTYNGRFTITKVERAQLGIGLTVMVSVSVDADPFKKRADQVIKAAAMGGTVIHCLSGRMPVHPIIETSVETTIVFDGKEFIVPAGTWSLPNVIFRQGVNDIYVNTYQIFNFLWPEGSTTWGDIGAMPIYQLTRQANDSGDNTIHTWDMLYKAGDTWPVEDDEITWADWSYISLDSINVKDVHISYEWGDL